MIIIDSSFKILDDFSGIQVLKKIERIGRVCYKSEENITEESCYKFVEMLIKNKHEAMIEHFSFSVLFVCDRGVSHEIVRHRLASFAQESTRYCNYSKYKFQNHITVIDLRIDEDETKTELQQKQLYAAWYKSCNQAEESYFEMIEHGIIPQMARSVLPNSLKTEIIMTANLREWRHFLRLRTAKDAHPQMRDLTIPLLKELKYKIPIVFNDIE